MAALKTVLLVEDNDDDVVLTMRALKSQNVANEVKVVTDGAAALDFLFARGEYANVNRELPQVVLLDLKLPKIDGLEVLRQMRAHPDTRLLPVVVLTSSNEERDLVESYSLGANSYIRKPVDFQQFTDAARALGLYWMVLNLAPPVRA